MTRRNNYYNAETGHPARMPEQPKPEDRLTAWSVSVMLVRHTYYKGESIEGGDNSGNYEEVTAPTADYDTAEGIYLRTVEHMQELESLTTPKTEVIDNMPGQVNTEKFPQLMVYHVVTATDTVTLLDYDAMRDFMSGFTAEMVQEKRVLVIESPVTPEEYDALSKLRGATS